MAAQSDRTHLHDGQSAADRLRSSPGHTMPEMTGKGLPGTPCSVTFFRMQSRCVISLFLFLFSICTRPATGATRSPAAATAPAGEKLVSDTPRATPDGATFVAPGGWWIETRTN